MNRLDQPNYDIDQEPPGGEEEDFPGLQVRGNVRNRNWYNVLYDERMSMRLHNRAGTFAFVPLFPHGHHGASVSIYLEQVPGTAFDSYNAKGFIVEDFNLSVSFRQPGTHTLAEWSDFIASSEASYEGLDIICAVVIDHQANGENPTLDITRVFNLQPEISANPTIPLRQANPEWLERYEVIAYDIKSIKACELWSSSVSTAQYKTAEEPLPITTHYIYQKKFEIDLHSRIAVKDLHLPFNMKGPVLPAMSYVPIDNQIYVVAYYRDPRQNDTSIFPDLAMEMEFQSRCYTPLE